jgi:hypothetical protein
METNNTVNVVPEHYNANQLVTYKVIEDGSTTFPTIKVNDLEWKLDSARRADKRLTEYISKVSQLEEQLPVWIENANDAETIVSEICSIFGFNPTVDIEFEATATITGTISVPLSEMNDFDIESVDLNIDVNSWSHDVNVDNVDVDNITSLR